MTFGFLDRFFQIFTIREDHFYQALRDKRRVGIRLLAVRAEFSDQLLRNNELGKTSQLVAFNAKVAQTPKGRGHIICMHGSEHEVAGIGGAVDEARFIGIPKLAWTENIRVFPQR